jgi:hypothetical protein
LKTANSITTTRGDGALKISTFESSSGYWLTTWSAFPTTHETCCLIGIALRGMRGPALTAEDAKRQHDDAVARIDAALLQAF